jgi:hypothetical protein
VAALLSEDEDDWWRCPECRNRYDVTRVEQLLVEAVERQLTRYCLQDVRCAKCRRVGTLLMAEACKCSGRCVAPRPRMPALGLWLGAVGSVLTAAITLPLVQVGGRRDARGLRGGDGHAEACGNAL